MTEETRPEPLVPANVDLRCYEFMPVHGDVLFRSSFFATASPEEFRAAMALWWSSWWEVPAASVPNDDVQLCVLAKCRGMRQWHRVRAAVMRKWVLCSDNRWYHPFLSPHAIRAYAQQRGLSEKGRSGAKKRWEINGHSHSTGIASAISTGNSTAIKNDGTGNSNETKRNTPQPPSANAPTSTPKAAAHSLANTQRQIAEQAEARARATPPPGGVTPSEFAKQATRRPSSFEDGP